MNGIELNQMRILSSTETTVMGIKTVTFMTTGLLMVAGAFGFSQLMARQGEVVPDDGGATLPVALLTQDASTTTPESTAADNSASASALAEGIEIKVPANNLEEAGAERGPATATSRTLSSGAPTATAGQSLVAAVGSTGSGMSMAPPSVVTASVAKAEFSRARARRVQERLHSSMNSTQVPELSFKGDTVLGDVLFFLEP